VKSSSSIERHLFWKSSCGWGLPRCFAFFNSLRCGVHPSKAPGCSRDASRSIRAGSSRAVLQLSKVRKACALSSFRRLVGDCGARECRKGEARVYQKTDYRRVPAPPIFHMWTAPSSQGVLQCFDQIACVHMSGLFVRSHMNADQDGLRDESSKQKGDLIEGHWKMRDFSRHGSIDHTICSLSCKFWHRLSTVAVELLSVSG